MEIRMEQKISNGEIAEYLAKQPSAQVLKVVKYVLANMDYPWSVKGELEDFLVTLPDHQSNKHSSGHAGQPASRTIQALGLKLWRTNTNCKTR